MLEESALGEEMEICRDVVGKITRRSDVGYLILSIVGCAAEFVWKIVIPLYEGA